MADEEIPAALETPASVQETPAPQPEPERILDPGEVLEAEIPELTAEEIETIEIDWDDGKKYSIPKALEPGLLKNKDYTTKTQELAARRQELDTRHGEIEQRLQATDEELKDRAILLAVKEQIEGYKNKDWMTLYRENPDAYHAQQAHFQQLQQLEAQTADSLKTKQTERTQLAEREFANRVEETISFAQKSIPGWKPELTETLVKFAQSEGIPDDAIKANWSPKFYSLLHKAHIGSLTLQKLNAPKPAPAQVAPLATVTGKATPAARTDLAAIDDMEAYIAARKKGVGGKAPF